MGWGWERGSGLGLDLDSDLDLGWDWDLRSVSGLGLQPATAKDWVTAWETETRSGSATGPPGSEMGTPTDGPDCT